MKATGEGGAPVFFVTLLYAADPRTDQAIARWIDEIQRRQTFALRSWHNAGEQAWPPFGVPRSRGPNQ